MRRLELRGVAGVALLAVIGLVSGPGNRDRCAGSGRPGSARRRSRQAITWPGMTRPGTVLLPNGWSLKPAGRQTRLGDFPVLIAVHPSRAGPGHPPRRLRRARGRDRRRRRPARSSAGSRCPRRSPGLVWSADGKQLFVGGGFDDVIYRFDHADGLLSNQVDARPIPSSSRRRRRRQRAPAGLAVSADGKTLWVANVLRPLASPGSTPQSGALRGEISARGRLLPLRPRLRRAARPALREPLEQGRGRRRRHRRRARSSAAGRRRSTPTRCSWRGAARSSTSPTPTATRSRSSTPRRARRSRRSARRSTPRPPPGSTPSSLALSPDESVLFVANANTNNLAVVNVKEPGASTPLGFIPTGWYPTSVRVARDGKTLYVANGKGATLEGQPRRPATRLAPAAARPTREYIAGLFQGTLSIIPMPDARSRWPPTRRRSTSAARCRRGDPPAVTRPDARRRATRSPAKVGDPSPITHCVYIIKENRTYDQVFGDMPEGNGEPNLCLFPEDVTPNHHALAREFVLLDNFYVEARSAPTATSGRWGPTPPTSSSGPGR